MRKILITSILVAITFHLKGQSIFKSTFSCDDDFFKIESNSIELKDLDNKTIIFINKTGLIFNDKKYLTIKNKNNINVIDSLSKLSIGCLNKNLRSFSSNETYYKISKRKRGGYNFVIKDDKNKIISYVKYSISNSICSVEINNRTIESNKILPLVFLVALGEINNYNETMKLMIFSILTAE